MMWAHALHTHALRVHAIHAHAMQAHVMHALVVHASTLQFARPCGPCSSCRCNTRNENAKQNFYSNVANLAQKIDFERLAVTVPTSKVIWMQYYEIQRC